MKKNVTIRVMMTILLALVAIAVTIAIVKVNVREIGPQGTSVGFADFNEKMRDKIGYSESFYKISKYIGYVVLLVAASFALLGLVQLIKRRSLFKVDANVVALGVIYVILAGIYACFEKFVVNYRPLIMEGKSTVEASFPSSHTILVCVIMGTAIMAWNVLIKNKTAKTALTIISAILIVAMVVTRVLSGVHWFTDIVAGIVYSGVLISLYSVMMAMIYNNKND